LSLFSIITSHPVACDSEDHLHPHGTRNDNHGDPVFVQEVEQFFGRKFGLMDLGCAGGQWVVDALSSGHRAVGVEGSDYNVRNGQFNWPVYHQKNLFTANVGKPFVVLEDGKLTTFDLITAWEVLEHIERDDLDQLMRNIENHLAPGGVFVGTVNYTDFVSEGHHYHRTVMKEKAWRKVFEKRFEVRKYPFRNYLRHDCVDIKDSFLVCLAPHK
jgi:2-polyprenyl-3-methyl-5-hydroxy-6-metoxy-1,4-benzoquinol methylase